MLERAISSQIVEAARLPRRGPRWRVEIPSIFGKSDEIANRGVGDQGTDARNMGAAGIGGTSAAGSQARVYDGNFRPRRACGLSTGCAAGDQDRSYDGIMNETRSAGWASHHCTCSWSRAAICNEALMFMRRSASSKWMMLTVAISAKSVAMRG